LKKKTQLQEGGKPRNGKVAGLPQKKTTNHAAGNRKKNVGKYENKEGGNPNPHRERVGGNGGRWGNLKKCERHDKWCASDRKKRKNGAGGV